MIRIVICDTDKKFVEELTGILTKEGLKQNIKCKFNNFTKAKDVISYLKEGGGCDVVFLETHIEDEYGVILGKHIKAFDKKIDLIFLSYVTKYTLDCFDIGAFNYMLKPIEGKNKERLVAQFRRLLIRYYMNRGDFLTIKESTGGIRLPIARISYIETVGKLVRIHYDKTFVDVHERMADLENRLEKLYFIRCHKSYLVNARYILKLEKTDLELNEGEIIPISRLRLKDVKHTLDEFFNNRDIV